MSHAASPSPISHVTRRRVAWLCLLSFALRALVPTGFMLSAAGGELELVVCDGSVPAPSATSHDGGLASPGAAHSINHDSHHHHTLAFEADAAGKGAVDVAASTSRAGQHAAQHAGHRAGHHAAGSQCPFALANAAGLAAAPPAVLATLTLRLRAPPLAAAHQIAAGPPLRFSAPRGPPSPA